MKVSAGNLDRRVTIKLVTYAVLGDGSRVEGRTTVGNIWAERETPAATERFGAQQTIADVDTLWRARWNDDLFSALDLSPKDHVLVYRDREYSILAVVEIGRKEGMHIPTKSRGDTGGTP